MLMINLRKLWDTIQNKLFVSTHTQIKDIINHSFTSITFTV